MAVYHWFFSLCIFVHDCSRIDYLRGSFFLVVSFHFTYTVGRHLISNMLFLVIAFAVVELVF